MSTSSTTTAPLSVGQEALWVDWKLEPDQWAHIIPTPFLVRGTLDIERLRSAIAAVGAAFPQLRARVHVDANGPRLDWSDAPQIPVRETVTGAGRDDAVRLAWQQPFDLRTGPLARVDLIRGPGYTVLLVAVHHLVYDGASILILLQALRSAYAGQALPDVDPAPALTRFAHRSRELADTGTGHPHRRFWAERLTPEPSFALPVSQDPPGYTVHSEQLPPELVSRLRERAAELGVSYLTVLLGGYYALLRRHTGSDRVLVFLPYHGRTEPELRDRLGYFVNALPIVAHPGVAVSYADLLRMVRQEVKQALAHGDLPLPAIMRAAGLTGPRARARTHQTVFQYLNTKLRDDVDVQDLRLSGDGVDARLSLLDMESVAGFTLAIMVREDSSGTHVLWKDPVGAVGPTVIAKLSADYERVLSAIAADPAQPVAAVLDSAPATPVIEETAPSTGTVDDTAVAEMVRVWQEVLGIDDIRPGDSFFELGGHSLLAESLVLAVSDCFGTEVGIRTLFDRPRLAEFTAAVAPVASGSVASSDELAAAPASSFQRRIWLAERLATGASAYHVPSAWRLGARLDPVALADALAQVVARHEILRTAFVERDGELWQEIDVPWRPEIDHVDLRGAAEPEAALEEWLADATRHPLDPASGRLVRAALVETGAGGQVLFLLLHHLVCDAESVRLLLRDLDRYYLPVAGSGPDVPVPPVAAAERAAEAPRLPRGRAPSGEFTPRSVPLPLDVTADAAGLGAEPADVLLAAFAAMLGWYSGSQDFLVGMAATGSERRVRPAVERSFRELVDEVAAETAVPAPEGVAALPVVFDDATAGERDYTTDRYELRLRVGPGDHGRLWFDAGTFDHDQIEAFSGHYRSALRTLLAEPDTRLGDLEPLSEDERHLQLAVWNRGDGELLDSTITDLVRDWARARPDAVAVSDEHDPLTYRDLVTGAERLAEHLVGQGVRPGELVALVVPRGSAQVTALLGVMFAGAAYLPIEASLPADRMRFTLTDSGTRWAVVTTATAGLPGLAGLDRPPVLLDRLPDNVQAPAGGLPTLTLDLPAYCIYTSGTTGRPKGVTITHRNVSRLLADLRGLFTLTPSDVWTNFFSYSFDGSVFEIFGGLSTGGRVVVVPEERAVDPAQLWQLLHEERVSVLTQTPSSFGHLVDLAPLPPRRLADLRYVILAGEALRPAVLAGWTRTFPHVRVHNLYGPTEATVFVTGRAVTQADIDTDSSTIGTPTPTATVFLLDPVTGRRLLPTGATGEMFLGGPGVAAGYLNRPDLTAERFVPSPFGPGTLFRSGDLARYRPDGTLEYLGRADSQIKVRGYRIELGEIEARLREHPAVTDAVAYVQEDTLAAVLITGNPPGAAELREFLARTLPPYMIPASFRVTDRAVLTKNGKLDVPALRAAATPLAADESAGTSAALTPGTESELGGLWAELLGEAPADAEESFFTVGGHSMLAVRLVGEIRARFGVTLPVRAIYETPRLRDLARLIDRGRTDGTAATPPDVFPASGFQRRLWLAEQLDRGPGYNVRLAWTSTGRLEIEELRAALARLVAGHEILRTSFRLEGGELTQVVGPAWQPAVELLDLSTTADPHAELRRWLDEAAEHRFDPAGGELLRVAVADLGAAGSALLLCVHHLVLDGESVSVLVRELDRYVQDVRAGVPSRAPRRQYRELVAAESATDSAELDFWEDRLTGVASRLDFPAPASAGPDGTVRLPLRAGTSERLRVAQTRFGVSWFTLFATALSVAVRDWTGAPSITIGVPVATRGAHADDALGPRLDTTVLRSARGETGSLPETLRAMRTEVLDAFEHAAPFDEVLARLDPPRPDGRLPYCDVMLDVNVLTDRHGTLGGAVLTPLFVESVLTRVARYGIVLTVVEDNGELTAVLTYPGARVSATDASALAAATAELVSTFADLPHSPAPEPGSVPSYRDFVAAQAAARDNGDHAADLDYWTHRLAGAPVYVGFPDPAAHGPDGSIPLPLAADTGVRLLALQDRHGVSPLVVAATSLALVLGHWTGCDDVVLGTRMTNRITPELAEVMGPCLNTVVLRSAPQTEDTLLAALLAMRATVLDAFEHAGAPFEDLLGRLNPPRLPGRVPFSDVVLAMVTESATPPTLGGAELRPVETGRHDAAFAGKFGLSVGLTATGSRLRGRITYQGDRYHRADVERFAEWFARSLALIAADPHRTPGAVIAALGSPPRVAAATGQVAQPAASEAAPPAGAEEEVIAELWAQVLGLPEVGRHDNFFDLGGNSLTLAALHSKLSARLARKIPITELFEHSTVATLAAAVRSAEPGSSAGRPHRTTRPVRRGRSRG